MLTLVGLIILSTKRFCFSICKTATITKNAIYKLKFLHSIRLTTRSARLNRLAIIADLQLTRLSNERDRCMSNGSAIIAVEMEPTSCSLIMQQEWITMTMRERR